MTSLLLRFDRSLFDLLLLVHLEVMFHSLVVVHSEVLFRSIIRNPYKHPRNCLRAQISNGTLANITLDDVLFRNVWICSGQSDMKLAVSQIFNGSLSPTVFARNSCNLVVRPLI
jgi:hypothetical protein